MVLNEDWRGEKEGRFERCFLLCHPDARRVPEYDFDLSSIKFRDVSCLNMTK